MPKHRVHRIDGTHLEGGGQLLRLATGLSALTCDPIAIENIRGKRSGGGGLKQQHLTCVQWLARACGAATRGAEKKSKTLEFWSKEHDTASLKNVRSIHKGKKVGRDGSGHVGGAGTVIDIGSPGAVGLVFQAILPYILFSGNRIDVSDHSGSNSLDQSSGSVTPHYITIRGGTNVSNSPSIDYIQHVLLPTLARIGLPEITAKCSSRGWSTGRPEIGAVQFIITPLANGTSLPAFSIRERGDIVKIQAIALGPRASEKAFHRELDRALKEAFPNVPFELSFEMSGHEKRLYLLLVAHTSTGLRLGRDHLFQERFSTLDYAIPKVVDRATSDLKLEIDHGGCVDEHMRDQLVVFQALANGRCEIETGQQEKSLHAQTAEWICSELLGIQPFDDDNPSCEGVRWCADEVWADRVKRSQNTGNLEEELKAMGIDD